jgi:hypothetical protein
MSEDTYKKDDMFILSKGSMKAIDLLNEKMYNKIFSESEVPHADVLTIYMLYFQLINHPIMKHKFDNETFWRECCNIMLREGDGKTGTMISNNLKNLEFNADSLYHIYNLIGVNITKINPNYFSKICGTTGLIVFFIKDIVDYLGLTFDKRTSYNRIVKTFSDVIEAFECRIQRLKRTTNKLFNINC